VEVLVIAVYGEGTLGVLYHTVLSTELGVVHDGF